MMLIPLGQRNHQIYIKLMICFYKLDSCETHDPPIPPPLTHNPGSIDLIGLEAIIIASSLLPTANTINNGYLAI